MLDHNVEKLCHEACNRVFPYGWHHHIHKWSQWQIHIYNTRPSPREVAPIYGANFHSDFIFKKYFNFLNYESMITFTRDMENTEQWYVSVQSLSRVRLFATPWIAARQASLSITISQSSLKLMSIELVMPSSLLILCRPLILLPPIPPSIRVFSNESALRMRWPKYCSFSFRILPSKEHPGLISFRIDSLVWYSCSPRDSQDSSPTPQFKSINSLAFNLLYGPTLTFLYDYWKNHSFD